LVWFQTEKILDLDYIAVMVFAMLRVARYFLGSSASWAKKYRYTGRKFRHFQSQNPLLFRYPQ